MLTGALPSSAIASTKTTVLGIRLDHDRRAWVEAAAASRGVTVRVLIEEMIDQSRGGEDAPLLADGAVAEAEDFPAAAQGDSLCDDVVALATLPARVLGTVVSRGFSIVHRAGRCARRVVVRH